MFPSYIHQEVVHERTREIRRTAQSERAIALAMLAAEVERPACRRARLWAALRPSAPRVCATCTCGYAA